MTSTLENLTVIGAGVLGGQIAWQSAFKGKQVTVYDLYEQGLEQCRTSQLTYAHIYQQDLGASAQDIQQTRERLGFSTDLGSAVAQADIVIEAVPEIAEVKTGLYTELASCLPGHTLLATNSSTFLPAQFAAATGRPEQYCAMHFANLIWSMNICEIMGHATVSDATLLAATRFAIEIGMVPIPVAKEQHGYICNTMLIALLQAAQTLVTNGVASPETVDRTYMITNRGCAQGPCALMDIIGMKTLYDVLNYWGQENQDEQMLANAGYIKERFVDRGLLGLQTGEGYYTYPDPSYQDPGFTRVPDLAEAPAIARLARLA